MKTAAEFSREVDAAADRVSAALSSGSPKTAWDLKMELKLPHTLLHLALGSLLSQGRVSLRPEGYTLLVETLPPGAAREPSSSRAAPAASPDAGAVPS